MQRTLSAGIFGLALASLFHAAPVAAHISLEQGGTHLSRYGDTLLKDGPCGKAAGVRGTHVYTYEPGATITVSVVEFVPHPGYFRLAFDSDGDRAFKEPASIKPVDPARRCPDGPGDHCGASDFYNTPAVLPGMDNLNPHLAGSGKPKYTWQVTLPNVECTNCTLQVIQVMEDDFAHGPYDPTPGVGVEDIYHQCIDLVLKRGAPPSDAGPGGGDAGSTESDAGEPSGGGAPEGGPGGAGGPAAADGGIANRPGAAGSSTPAGSGGCAVSRGDAAAGLASSAAFLFGLALLRSRRRPRPAP